MKPLNRLLSLLKALQEQLATKRQRDACGEMISMTEKAIQRLADIDADQNRSTVGKENAKVAVRQEVTAAVRPFVDRWTKAERDAMPMALAEVNKAALSPEEDDPTDLLGVKRDRKTMVKAARAAEIRASVAHLDDLQLEIVYLTGTDEMREAVGANAPPRVRVTEHGVRVSPWVSPEVIANHRMGAASANDPEAVQRLRDIQEHERMIGSLASMLTEHLSQEVPYGPVPQAPPSAPAVFKDADGHDVPVPAAR